MEWKGLQFCFLVHIHRLFAFFFTILEKKNSISNEEGKVKVVCGKFMRQKIEAIDKWPSNQLAGQLNDHFLTYWMNHSLTDWLTYWLTHLLTDLMIDLLTDWVTH